VCDASCADQIDTDGGGEVDEAEFVEAIIYAVMSPKPDSSESSAASTPRDKPLYKPKGPAADEGKGPNVMHVNKVAPFPVEPQGSSPEPQGSARGSTSPAPAFDTGTGVPFPAASTAGAAAPGKSKTMGSALFKAARSGELSKAVAAADGADRAEAIAGPSPPDQPETSLTAPTNGALPAVSERAKAMDRVDDPTDETSRLPMKVAWAKSDSPTKEGLLDDSEHTSNSRAVRSPSEVGAARKKAPSESRAQRFVRAKLHKILKAFGRGRRADAVQPSEGSDSSVALARPSEDSSSSMPVATVSST
jgi:hypothetical protein